MKEEKTSRGKKIFTGVAGEHYVAAELSRHGAIATITSKNTPDFDVIGANKDGTHTAIIQVKTGTMDTGGFIVGTSVMRDYPLNSFHIFVLIKNNNTPEYWIIPSKVVADVVETDYQNFLKKKSVESSRAPRTLRWNHLKSDEFMKNYHNQWEILGIFPKQP